MAFTKKLRCKKGTRRNKKTGECEANKTQVKVDDNINSEFYIRKLF